MWTSALLAVVTAAAPAIDPGRTIRYRVDVPASIATVWADWTEPAQVAQWFARGSRIEAKPFGRYDILFAPEAEAGQRGAENNLVLAVQPPHMLAFTWDAPPHLPAARQQRTSVVVRLESLAADRTRVWFEQTGWGRGGEWDQAFDYFTSAWRSVLSLLHYRHAVGPVDWLTMPLQETLAEHARAVETW